MRLPTRVHAFFSNPRKLSGLLVLALLVGTLVGVHLYVGTQGRSYSGPLMFFDSLFDLGAVLVLLAISTAFGHRALERCGVVVDRPLETVIFAAAVGLGLVATLILVLGLLGGLQTSSLLLLLAVIAVLVRKQLGELPPLIAQGVTYVKSHGGGKLPFVTGTAVFCAVAIFMIIFAMAPAVDWDTLMYHLEVPSRFLDRGRIYLPEDNLHTAFIGLSHMLYLPLLAIGSASGPALLNVLLALMLGVGVFSFCSRFLPGPTGSLTLTVLWGMTTILLVAITPRLDVTVALYLFLAHYALLAALSSSDRSHLYLAAALLGFALGVKYHAAPYMIGLVPLIIWAVAAQTRRNLWMGSRSLLTFGLVAFAAALPWLAKNLLLFGAPLHPFFAPVALEPWLVPLFGSQIVPPSVNPQIFDVLAQARSPFNLADAFFAPHRLTIEPEGVFYRANPALLLLPGWIFFIRNRVLNWLVIPAVGYLFVLLVPFPETNLRYLIPAVAPLTIVVVFIAVKSAERVFSTSAAHLLLVLLAALTLLPSGRVMYAWLTGTKALGHVVGVTSADEYMADRLALRVYHPVVRHLNSQLPADSRILMLFEARAFYVERSVIQDIRLSNWPLLAQVLEGDACLPDAGITHVLLGAGAMGYYLHRGADPELVGLDAFATFRQRCLTHLHETPGFILFEVN
jgi:hypothetical protein